MEKKTATPYLPFFFAENPSHQTPNKSNTKKIPAKLLHHYFSQKELSPQNIKWQWALALKISFILSWGSESSSPTNETCASLK